MTRGQHIDFMVKTVLPRMKAEFVAFDAKRFARMDCATCHGDTVRTGSFTLPNPELPKLSVEGGFAKHKKAAPEMTEFMMQKVVPDTAALLEVPAYDPATHQGLGCFTCHVREADAPLPSPATPTAPQAGALLR
jgi:hypothetical protein